MADASSSAACPQLKPLGQHADKPAIRIHRPVFMIGSRNSAHLHLLSRQVDKAHALILKDDQGIYLRDLCSRNHVFVNAQPIVEAWLKDGDQIKIGSFTFRLLANGFDEGEPRLLPPGRIELSGRSIPLEERVLLIGRRDACHLPLDDSSVSTEHAIIFAMGGAWYLRDLGSRTGTFLNDEQIHQKVLAAGDHIRIGPAEMRFEPTLQPEAAASADVEELDQLLAAGLATEEAPLPVDDAAADAAPTAEAPAPPLRPQPHPQPQPVAEAESAEPLDLASQDLDAEIDAALLTPDEPELNLNLDEPRRASEPPTPQPHKPESSAEPAPAAQDEAIPLQLEEEEALPTLTPGPPPANQEPDRIALDQEEDLPDLLAEDDLEADRLNVSASSPDQPETSPDQVPPTAASQETKANEPREQSPEPQSLTQSPPEPPVAEPSLAEATTPPEPADITEAELEPLPRRGWRRSLLDEVNEPTEASEATPTEDEAASPAEEALPTEEAEKDPSSIEPPAGEIDLLSVQEADQPPETEFAPTDAAPPTEEADAEPPSSAQPDEEIDLLSLQEAGQSAEVKLTPAEDAIPAEETEAETPPSAPPDEEIDLLSLQEANQSPEVELTPAEDAVPVEAPAEEAPAAVEPPALEALPIPEEEKAEQAEEAEQATSPDITAAPADEAIPAAEPEDENPPPAPEITTEDDLTDALLSPEAEAEDLILPPVAEAPIAAESADEAPPPIDLTGDVELDDEALSLELQAAEQADQEDLAQTAAAPAAETDEVEELDLELEPLLEASEPAAEDDFNLSLPADEAESTESEPSPAELSQPPEPIPEPIDVSEPSPSAEIELLQPEMDAAEAVDEADALDLHLDEPQVSDPSEASSSGELDFSNLKLDLNEEEPPEEDLGLELLDSPDEPPPAEPLMEEEETVAKSEADEPELISLDALADVLTDAPDDELPSEPNEPPSAEAPVTDPVEVQPPPADPSPQPERRTRRKMPLRGPDGKFIKRRKVEEPSPPEEAPADAADAAPAPEAQLPEAQSPELQAAEGQAPEIAAPEATAADPLVDDESTAVEEISTSAIPPQEETPADPRPTLEAGDSESENPAQASESETDTLPPPQGANPAVVAEATAAQEEPSANPSSLLNIGQGMGANLGGFFGGVPLGLEETPNIPTVAPSDHPEPSEEGPVAPPRMLHPFDWDPPSEAASQDFPLPEVAPEAVRATTFDGLAMNAVRQADVFSQLPPTQAEEALLNGHVDPAASDKPPLDPITDAAPLPRQPTPVQTPWSAIPLPPAPPARRRWFGLGMLLGVMLLCMALAVGGIWLFVRPQSLVRGVLPFEGPQPTLFQQRQQMDLLNDPHVRQAARRILQEQHLDGGFLNDDPIYRKFTADAQWAADGLVLTRSSNDMSGDQNRIAALLTALYRAPANQAMVDRQANLSRKLEDFQARETELRDQFRDIERQVKAMEENPPPVPTDEEQLALQRRLSDLKEAWETGKPPRPRTEDRSWLLAPFLETLDAQMAQARAASPTRRTDAQAAYLQALVQEQKMQSQLEEARKYQHQLQEKRQQRRAAQTALQQATQDRLAAQEERAAALAPQSPAMPSAVSLQDPRPTYAALALAAIALVFMFLILLSLLVGHQSGAQTGPRPQPTPRPVPPARDANSPTPSPVEA